jgi:hypothetical protein
MGQKNIHMLQKPLRSFIAQSRILEATGDLILLIMSFIEEWSDILSGVDILDGCSEILNPSPYVEQIDEIWKISLEYANELALEQKTQLIRAMPNFFTAKHDASNNIELLWCNGMVVCNALFMDRESSRQERITFGYVQSLTSNGLPITVEQETFIS